MVVGLPGNKSFYSNRLILVFQSLSMMYDYKLNLVVRTPRACPWESSVNGMEPFLWEELEPFQFGYIAGHAAEVPTVDGAELRRRVFEEVAEEYRPTVERTMQTTGLALYPESEALLRLPAFLPVYFMDCGEVQAAVNGQTGKVSVLAEKETRTYPWVIEPLLGTLAVMIFSFLHSGIMAECRWI